MGYGSLLLKKTNIMKVRFLIPMAGRDILFEAGKEYEVEKAFGKRLIDGLIAIEIKEEKKATPKKAAPKKKK